jgi:hypothetical protein
MINGTKLLRDDKTRWTGINVPATRRITSTGITRRIGAVMFAVNDMEARWRCWGTTELCGGLARRYRDRRFDTWTGAPGDDTDEIERLILLDLLRRREVDRPDQELRDVDHLE